MRMRVGIVSARPFRFALRLCPSGDDADDLTILAAAYKRDGPFGEREQSVVPAHPDVAAWEKARTPLAQDDVARDDAFASKSLHTEALALRIAPVPRRTETLLMSETLQINVERQPFP